MACFTSSVATALGLSSLFGAAVSLPSSPLPLPTSPTFSFFVRSSTAGQPSSPPFAPKPESEHTRKSESRPSKALTIVTQADLVGTPSQGIWHSVEEEKVVSLQQRGSRLAGRRVR